MKQAIQSIDGETLDVIVRMHDPRKMAELSHCIMCLFGQDHDAIHPIIVLQGFDSEAEDAVRSEVSRWPWRAEKTQAPTLVNVPNPDKADLRSKLLNVGLKQLNGRYLAFLDYDDVIYADAYKYLISCLRRNPENSIAFGDVLRTVVTPSRGYYYQESKSNPFQGDGKLDMFVQNFCPIHSFVIDRTRIDDSELFFDEGLSRNEDYHFLVRILSKYEADFESRQKIVGEYFVRTDGSNTINSEYTGAGDSAAKTRAWRLADLKMEELFEERFANIRISELRNLKIEINRLSSTVQAGDSRFRGAFSTHQVYDLNRLLKRAGNSFVEDVYWTFLNRAPEAGICDQVVQRLDSGLTKIDYILEVTQSEEFTRSDNQLNSLLAQIQLELRYRHDAKEESSDTCALFRTYDVDKLLKLDCAQFVIAVYNSLLLRNPEPGIVEQITKRIDSGMSRVDYLISVLESEEFQLSQDQVNKFRNDVEAFAKNKFD